MSERDFWLTMVQMFWMVIVCLVCGEWMHLFNPKGSLFAAEMHNGREVVTIWISHD